MFYKLFTSLIALSLLFSLGTAQAEEENFRLRAHQQVITDQTEADVQAEIEFGRIIAARILGQFSIVDNEELVRYVNLVGRSISYNSSRNDIEFFFTVLDADFINAYSAPGGYVFITSGAIKAMKNEAELAAVLAHEVAHISEKHIVKEFKIRGMEKSASAGLSQLLGSSTSSAKVAFAQAVDNAVSILLEKGYKQDDELESDRVALMLLAATGYNPMSLSKYLKRIQKKSNKAKNPKHKPTHPPTSSRIDNLAAIAKQEGLNQLKLPVGKSRFEKYAKR